MLKKRRSFTIDAGRNTEWTTLREQWFTDYHPETATRQQMVLRAAESDWLLRLEEERYQKAELALVQEHGDPLHWTPERHKHLHFFERRLDRAQRTLLRFERVAEQARRARFTETLRLEAHTWSRQAHQANMQVKQRAAAKTGPEAEPPPPPPPPFKPAPYQQWIEARIENGITVTSWSPRHPSMQSMLDKRAQPHELVERSTRLPDPLPPEYEWARTPDGKPVFYMNWLTTVEQFRQDMARDLAEGNGHLTRSPHMPLYQNQEEKNGQEN